MNRTLLPNALSKAFFLLLAISLGSLQPGCSSPSLPLKMFPGLGLVTAKAVAVHSMKDSSQQLPPIMRFRFEGRMGWISFEERYQDKVWATYHLEAPTKSMVVAGEYGSVEKPETQSKADDSIYGSMELTKIGKSLKGSFKSDTEPGENGELELSFSKNMQSFIGKWRHEGEKAWADDLTGTAQ